MTGDYRRSRAKLSRRYTKLYKRVTGFDMDKCAYCGFPREALDHAPAMSLLEGIDVKKYIELGGKFLLYPACSDCNKYLSNHPVVSFYDRLSLLSGKYERKMDKIERWSEYEISQMGYSMQCLIRAKQSKLDTLLAKHHAVEEKITKINIGEMTEDGIPL